MLEWDWGQAGAQTKEAHGEAPNLGFGFFNQFFLEGVLPNVQMLRAQ